MTVVTTGGRRDQNAGNSTAAAIGGRRRRAAIAAGTWLPNLPAPQVQQHIDTLVAAGMSYRAIARAAQVAERTVRGIRQHTFVQGRTAAAILGVKPAAYVPKLRAGLVSSLPASCRIRALVAIGWSLSELSRQSGMCLQQVWETAWRRSKYVSQETHDRVCDLFERLSATPGSSARARRFAADNGWFPPLDLDDSLEHAAEPAEPDYEVDDVVVDRALAGARPKLNDRELIAAVQVGTSRRRLPLTEVADLLHIRFDHAKLLQAGQLPPRRAKRATKRLEAAAA